MSEMPYPSNADGLEY